MTLPAVVVGVLARIEPTDQDGVRQRLALLGGVSTFELGSHEKLGVLIEADGLDAAHGVLRHQVQATPGVLCAWPVSVELDDVHRTPDQDRPQEPVE